MTQLDFGKLLTRENLEKIFNYLCKVYIYIYTYIYIYI